MPDPKLHLASSSPRRSQILERMGLEFTAAGVDIDEHQHPGESADIMVVRLAVEKACAVAPEPGKVVLGADTAVVLDGEVFGKPADQADALRMLGMLSGRCHQVMTGVAVRSGSAADSVLSVRPAPMRYRDSAGHSWSRSREVTRGWSACRFTRPRNCCDRPASNCLLN